MGDKFLALFVVLLVGLLIKSALFPLTDRGPETMKYNNISRGFIFLQFVLVIMGIVFVLAHL